MDGAELTMTEGRRASAVGVFVVVAYGLAWLVTLPLWLAGGLADPLFPVLAIAMMATPTIAALVALLLVIRPAHPARALGLVPLRPVPRLLRYAALGLGGPIALGLVALLIAVATGQAHLDLGFRGFATVLATAPHPLPHGIPVTLVAVLTLIAVPLNAVIGSVAALGEELGWRGFLLPLLRPLGTARALILTGVVWGLWHAPLILLGYDFGRRDALGLLLMVIGTVLLGVPIGWLRMRSASVWPCALAHGSVNASVPVLLLVLLGDPSDVAPSLIGWAGWIVLCAVIALLVATRSFRWADPQPMRTRAVQTG